MILELDENGTFRFSFRPSQSGLLNPEYVCMVVLTIKRLNNIVYSDHRAILWNFTTKKHKVDDYLLILRAFFHRIHVQNTGILATYRNIIIKRNYVVTPAQYWYELRPVNVAFMFFVRQICNEIWWMMLLNKIG